MCIYIMFVLYLDYGKVFIWNKYYFKIKEIDKKN